MAIRIEMLVIENPNRVPVMLASVPYTGASRPARSVRTAPTAGRHSRASTSNSVKTTDSTNSALRKCAR